MLVPELVVPRDRGIPNSGHRDRTLHGITVENRMEELRLTVDHRKCDLLLEEDFVVVYPTGEFPGLLVEPMRQIPETRVVDYPRQVYHREVDSPL